MIRTAPGGWVLAADLGLNQLLIYQLDQAKGQLTHAPSVGATLPAGAGPRHFDFHPNGRLVYCINELGSTLTTFSYDAGQGQLTELQTISTLPADFTANNSCADIHVHPNGKFLYGSNRGHDSIALFSIEKGSGIPTLIGHTPSGGRTPRNFAIDPTGTLMLVANQDSDNVVSFMIDPATGALTPTGQEVTISAPVCVCFA
jgi:6-phosphogluconolactonase